MHGRNIKYGQDSNQRPSAKNASTITIELKSIPSKAVFGLGLTCQAKGHSNRIPTFQTLPRFYGNNRKKNEEKCEPQLAKRINALQKRPVETKIYFQLNMIVSFKFKRNTERYLILIVRNGLIENFEIR